LQSKSLRQKKPRLGEFQQSYIATIGQSVDNWVKHNAKDRPVDLPPILVTMLGNKLFQPVPRNEFKQLLDNVKVGQQIKLSSLGQEPKHYGEGYQGKSFLVTEQMMEM
jgi:hypothetical protein